MEIIRDFMTVSDVLPTEKTVSVVTINYKRLNELHAGHNYIVNLAKSKSEILMVNFCEQNGASAWFERPFEYSDFNEGYCLDWCRKNQVDYVLMFSCDSIIQTLQKYDLTAIKAQADYIYDRQNYSRFQISDNWVRGIKFVIGTFLLMQQENKLYNQNYRIRSWNDGIYPFIIRDFYKKYYKDIDIVNPIRDEHDIIVSTTLLHKPVEFKLGLSFIRNEFEKEFLKGNHEPESLRISVNQKLVEQKSLLTVTSVKYYNEEITNNKPLLSYMVHNIKEGYTYFMVEYFYYI